ncbi:glycosyltransferase family 39 protein [Micromonospora sp. CPCC 206061]|uniref:glycosyltransferase family 39 protein n=1 Tax=Micromonospora sp. CPCC 206061 TaxID=3122410 RepID=UPI002FF156AE
MLLTATSRRSVPLAVWPALVTLLLTGAGATAPQLWRDEMATWSAATRSPGDLVHMVKNIDAVSGPYYLFMHYWIAIFGDSVLALRAPSILCMAGVAALVTVIGKHLFGAPAGVLAGLLFAVVPSTSRYAQEARSYAFATFFALLATLLLIRALDLPSWGRWAAYGAAVTATGLSHLIAVTVVAGHAVAAVLAGRHVALRWGAATGASTVALLPLVILGKGQQNTQLGWVPTPSAGDLLTVSGYVFRSGMLAGITIGLAALGWAMHARWGAPLALCAVGPAVLLWTAGQVTQVWVPRYLTFTVPFLCLLAGAALAEVRLRGALAVVATFLLISAPDQRVIRRSHDTQPLDYQAAAAIIREHQRLGDGIAYAPRGGWRFLDTAMDYHLRDDRPDDVLLKQNRAALGSFWASDCDRPADCLNDVDRVWVLAVGDQRDPLRPMERPKADAIRATYTLAESWTVPGLTVALYTGSR